MHRFMLFVGLGTALLAGACGRTRPETPLGLAAMRNDATRVRRLLADGIGADEAETDGMTPLMWAARFNALDAMIALLDGGADPNARDNQNRWTPLLHAIHRQNPEAVDVLLDRKADPNLAAPGGLAPLLMAADDPNPKIVRALLQHGANPRIEGPGGRTPLTQAVSGGALTDFTDRPLLGGCHAETVRAFLTHDPTLKVPDTAAGHQALWWARFHRCDAVLRLLDYQAANLIHRTHEMVDEFKGRD